MKHEITGCGKAVPFEEFECAPHGFGLGVGTDAEGWLYRAVSFWQAQEVT